MTDHPIEFETARELRDRLNDESEEVVEPVEVPDDEERDDEPEGTGKVFLGP